MQDDSLSDPERSASDVGPLVDALGRADRAGAPQPDWNRFMLEIERPALGSRIPLALTAMLRPAAELGRPAVAGALAATFTGVALGTWLAVAFDRGPTATALATTSYSGSSLLDDDAASGLDSYLAEDSAEPTSTGDTLPGSTEDRR
jgi:hypothetical protein